VKVTNTGSKEGWHAVDLYSRDLYASVTPSIKKLRAFSKVFLKAGESKDVSFTLTRDDLSFVNESGKWVTEPGEFEILVGDKKAGFTYKQ
jgi:beta-glucosidase